MPFLTDLKQALIALCGRAHHFDDYSIKAGSLDLDNILVVAI